MSEREARARSILLRAGVEADVSAEGLAGEIAAVRSSPDQMPMLRRLAPEIRGLGYRYVALDLTEPISPNRGRA